MFDIGFTEIMLIAVVSLVVIGPKRLPETVRFLGYWLGKIKRSVHGARQDMEREFGLDEIRRELYNEELLGRMEDERQQIARRLGSPITPVDAPIPANLKTPAEEDFIDERPSEAPARDENPSDSQAEEQQVADAPVEASSDLSPSSNSDTAATTENAANKAL
ncbi:twin arginine-targeting protein translocase TatB [Gammaproteobacteria bacterium 53_120_T64]|nr:twin arginine-targeting protein translocase TatB [Gammaproteobacteria bacterium 53_120_T64]